MRIDQIDLTGLKISARPIDRAKPFSPDDDQEFYKVNPLFGFY